MFDYCSTKCHTTVSQPIAVNVGRKKTKIAYVTGNPSQAHPLCKKFINQYGDDLLGQQEELLGQEANLTKEGYRFDPRLHFLGWVRILGKGDKEVITCYPHKNTSKLELARSMWDFPYQENTSIAAQPMYNCNASKYFYIGHHNRLHSMLSG